MSVVVPIAPGAPPLVCQVVVKDTLGNVIDPSLYDLSFTNSDPTVVQPSPTTFGAEQFQALKVGSSNVQWKATLKGGGSAVADTDVLTASLTIGSVTTSYAPHTS